MSRLPRNLGRLDEKSGLPLYQQLQRLLKGAIERNVIARERRPSARARPRLGARRFAHHRAQGDRRAGCRGPPGAPPGVGNIREGASREEFLPAFVIFRGHARARTAPAQCLAQAIAGHRDAGRGADDAPQPGNARVPPAPHPLRGRSADGARIRDCPRILPAFRRKRRRIAVRGSRDKAATAP